MAAPFSFAMDPAGAAFSMGSNASVATAPAALSGAASSGTPVGVVHVPVAVRGDAFPACLTAASLPPCPLLLVAPALHAHRGRVLVATTARAAGEPLLHEAAFVASNWDSFRCAECDKPHATKRCPKAKAKWAKKIINKIAEVEGSLSEAPSIGSLDHARSFMKLLQLSFVESTLGVGSGRGTLADFKALSSTKEAECARSLSSKLPYQSASPRAILEDVGAWPPGMELAEAATLLAILNTNSHELSDIRGSGIFLRASLMEHSCIPNCNFSTTGREMQILALRPIAAGENLSIDYGMGLYRPVSERRKALLKSHGFVCFCQACTQRPDKARAFTCPTVMADGRACPGVVYPVGADDRAAEEVEWKKLVEGGAAFIAQQAEAARRAGAAAPLLPVQQAPESYPSPLFAPWSCTHCAGVLTPPQIAQCLQREKEAARALRSYSDEDMEEEEEAQFDFDNTGARRRGSDDEGESGEDEDAIDDDEEEDDGDEIRPPFPLIERLKTQSAPSLHPSHHTFFWALDFYARSCSSDEDFAADAIPIFEQLLTHIRAYLSPELSESHDALVIYHDYLAQVLVVTGQTDRARLAFRAALEASARVNGRNHHSTLELAAMVENTPESAEELQMQYAQFQENMEALLFDTAQAKAKEKKKSKGGKKSATAGRRGRGGAGASESESEEEALAPEEDVAVTPATQAALMARIEELMLQQADEKRAAEQARAKDQHGDDNMGTASASGKQTKGKGKGKK